MSHVSFVTYFAIKFPASFRLFLRQISCETYLLLSAFRTAYASVRLDCCVRVYNVQRFRFYVGVSWRFTFPGNLRTRCFAISSAPRRSAVTKLQ